MPRENLVGTTVGKYRIVDLIGEGGTSTVYRAEHAEHGTSAVKVLREKLRSDKTAVARFLREAAFGLRVQHPNVVRTIEIGEPAPDVHFLAIEWATGELLERYAKRHAPLAPDEVIDIITQIASAVHAAHAEGIVHRDLKPDNVMYDPETRTVKLLDFGIAADTDMTPEQRLTRSGFFVGTLMYVAPESLSGEVVTPAADQFSLATIAYLLLTGVLPYPPRSQREMFTQLLTQPPTPLSKARDGLTFSAATDAVMAKGLAKHPNDRYPDVDAFAAALAEALRAPQVPEKKTGFFSRVARIFG